jgi:phage shock protein PspC (stress-responsive transcriptional regulator)
MKRVETININGIVFGIDNDAYDRLTAYMEALSKYFNNEQGGNEIISDIEARIAELFAERSGEVITTTDVSQAISVLGSLEDITGTNNANAGSACSETNSEAPKIEKLPKRLYRDPDKRYLGGVCAGLSNWFGINPVILRILFVVTVLVWFIGFIPIVTYIVLWMIIPLAKTTAQKLEMRGKPVNISNIEKSIKEQLSSSELKQSFRQFLSEAGEVINKLFQIVIRVAGAIFGLMLSLYGIGIILFAGALLFMQDFIFRQTVEWDLLSFNELLRHIIPSVSYYILYVCAILIVLLFVSACVFWGGKLMTGYRVKNRSVHILLTLVWVGMIGIAVIVGVSEGRNYMWHNEIIETKTLAAATDTLYLGAIPSSLKISNNPLEVYYDKDKGRFYGKPNLDIRKSNEERIRWTVERRSQGKNKLEAYQYAEAIVYEITVDDSLLTFPIFFTVEPQDRWKFQFLHITVYVPEGTVIIADQTLCEDRMFFGYWHYWQNNPECKWVMTADKGLQRLKKE